MKLNIIDDYTENFSEEAENADLIILACPVERAEQNIEILAGLSFEGTCHCDRCWQYKETDHGKS